MFSAGQHPVAYATAEPILATAVPMDSRYPSAPMVGLSPPPPPATLATGTGINPANEALAREFLRSRDFPSGLENVMIESVQKMPYRFFIVDDSGSMSTSDGKKLYKTGNRGMKMIGCSRWAELTDALHFHLEFAMKVGAPTEFRLLNGAAPLTVGTGDAAADSAHCTALQSIFGDSPGGGTPLCRHIREVTAHIRSMQEQLRANGSKACVIICTDGEASDGDMAEAMRPLKDMPVWVVVRLCTDEDRVVDYWNNIDQQLELSMDVLDDLSGEAKEVKVANGWLTYGEPMHRLREWGTLQKEFDLLDESALNKEQMWRFCTMIYGGHRDQWPHPEVDFAGFCRQLERQNRSTPKVWDTTKNRLMEWIEVSRVRSKYGGACSIM